LYHFFERIALIVCHTYTPLQFIGLDSETTANELEQFALLTRHFGAIDAHPLWRRARKIFIPENNLGLEASHMDTLVRGFNNVESFWETKKRVGIRMTHELKRKYQMFTVHALYNRKFHPILIMALHMVPLSALTRAQRDSPL
jgi:hypothetical protein